MQEPGAAKPSNLLFAFYVPFIILHSTTTSPLPALFLAEESSSIQSLSCNILCTKEELMCWKKQAVCFKKVLPGELELPD